MRYAFPTFHDQTAEKRNLEDDTLRRALKKVLKKRSLPPVAIED